MKRVYITETQKCNIVYGVIPAAIFWGIIILLVACSPKQEKTKSTKDNLRIITDMSGRELEIPAVVDSVFSRCPMGTILTYSINPSKIAGLNWKPTPFEREYLTKEYCQKPLLAGWFATFEGNKEEILKTKPDIIFSSAREPGTNVGSKDQADKIQKTLNIPVVIIDSGISKIPAIYRFTGKLLGEEERSDALAEYTQNMIDYITEKSQTIPEDKRIRIYYAEGADGMETDPSGSMHSELIDFIGAINVAEVRAVSGQGGMGRAKVSPEQLMQWDPDIIITCHDQGFSNKAGTYEAILGDKRFASIKAVKEGKVYEIPYIPFNIFDRPPSVNRIIGAFWLANLAYPEIYNFNIREEFKKFYTLFYSIELTEEQLDEILQNVR